MSLTQPEVATDLTQPKESEEKKGSHLTPNTTVHFLVPIAVAFFPLPWEISLFSENSTVNHGDPTRRDLSSVLENTCEEGHQGCSPADWVCWAQSHTLCWASPDPGYWKANDLL